MGSRRAGLSWGVFDTQDNLWIGDDHGPKLFPPDQEDIAKVACQVIAMQAGWPLHRLRARQYDAGSIRIVDEQPLHCSGLAALRRVEKGEL